jgi:hypothetical protein
MKKNYLLNIKETEENLWAAFKSRVASNKTTMRNVIIGQIKLYLSKDNDKSNISNDL